MGTFSRAEEILRELGVTAPEELDIEAIAYYLGARVMYKPLDGCEARIIGVENKAIITVNEHSSLRRRRFSIAHELGHWCCHRGQHLVCNVPDPDPQKRVSDPEQVANMFASDILMPDYLFKPALKSFKQLNIKSLRHVSDQFDTSLTATAIRMIKSNQFPCMLVCYGQNGRRWFVRSPSIPDKWFPVDKPDADSCAIDILFGTKNEDSHPHKSPADIWFDNKQAGLYEIFEQSFKAVNDEILTILTLDPQMLAD